MEDEVLADDGKAARHQNERGLANAWETTAKARWCLGHFPDALAAFRQAAEAEKRALAARPFQWCD